jgi:hypothetical protein
MRARKILAVFSAVGLLWGVSCALNPQPEPPITGLGGRNNDDGTTTGGPVVSMGSDGGLNVPATGDNADGATERQDSSITSDGSSADGGSPDDRTEAGNAEEAGAEEAGEAGAESSSDGGADALEEGTTTAD